MDIFRTTYQAVFVIYEPFGAQKVSQAFISDCCLKSVLDARPGDDNWDQARVWARTEQLIDDQWILIKERKSRTISVKTERFRKYSYDYSMRTNDLVLALTEYKAHILDV